jgi:(heptosyl)LPS beta-1,4-glucosyltransferase
VHKKSHATPPKLSVLIQTRNEISHIKSCINSCRSIANEIIVLDMGSHDKTKTIAEKLGAHVFSVKNKGYVEAARQHGISLAKHEWILLLDADEKITPSLSKLILRLIHEQAAAFRIPRKNIFLSQWMQHGLQWPDYQIRLFRKQHIYWPAVIHTQPIVTGKVIDVPAQADNAIIHNYRTTIKQAVEKIVDQSAHEQHYATLTNLTEKHVIKRIENDFSWRYFENEGYKDGIRGFILAKLWEYYRFLEFAQYAENHQFPEIISDPENVKNKHLQQKIVELEQELKRLKDSKFFPLFKLYEKTKKILLNDHS